MPLQIAPCVTLEEVEKQLQAMETEHGIATEEFVANPLSERQFSEDVAMEWSFLIEQRQALASISSLESAPLQERRNRYATPSKLKVADTSRAFVQLAA